MIHDFGWVLQGRLAAFGLPMPPATPLDVQYLQERSVSAVVSLTEEPCFDGGALTAIGMRSLHLPVPDMASPTQGQIESFVDFVDAAAPSAVAVHCRAGLGRTGTMVACYLVHLGATADTALQQVRRLRPGSVETRSQESSVRLYAESQSTRNRQRA